MAVTVPALLGDLATVKNRIGAAGTADDTLITGLGAEVYGLGQTICGRRFASAVHTELHDGEGVQMLYVDNPPITAVTSIHDDPDREWGAGTLLVNGTDYIWQNTAEAGMIRRVSGITTTVSNKATWQAGQGNVKIVYTGGWKLTGTGLSTGVYVPAVPDGFLRTMYDAIAEAYSMVKEAAQGKAAESIGGSAITWKTDAFRERLELALRPWSMTDRWL